MKKIISIFLVITMLASVFTVSAKTTAKNEKLWIDWNNGLYFNQDVVRTTTYVDGGIEFSGSVGGRYLIFEYCTLSGKLSKMESYDGLLIAVEGLDGNKNTGIYLEVTGHNGSVKTKDLPIVQGEETEIIIPFSEFNIPADAYKIGIRVADYDYPSKLNIFVSDLYLCNIETTDEPPALNAQLSLDDSIDLSFIPENVDTATTTATFAVDGVTVAENVKAVDGKYTFDGITPADMDKNVTSTLYKNGVEVISATTSVEEYCKSLINDATQPADVRDLAVAILNYGGAVQEYLHETDTVTDGVTRAITSSNAENWNGEYILSGKNSIGAWLELSNSIAIQILAQTDAKNTLIVKDSSGNIVQTCIGVQTQNGVLYTFSTLTPANFADRFTFTVDNATLTYSVEAYAKRMYDANVDLQNLLIAVMTYGDYANLYVK